MAMSFCEKHCSECISPNCTEKACPVVQCVCTLRMHECKRRDHKDEICPEAEVDCPIKCLGCPLKIKRGETRKHLNKCPANTIVCKMQRFRLFQKYGNLLKHMNPVESDPIVFNCFVHDMALMRRLGKKMEKCEIELKSNPKREEIESRIREEHGCKCGSWSPRSYYFLMGDSDTIVHCQHVIRREESLEHRESHLTLPQLLQGNCCPMQRHGCHYQPQAIEFDKKEQTVRFDQEICGLVADWEPQELYEVDYDRISTLSYDTMSLVLENLDSFSLRNLSLTSRRMREICFERLYTSGVVDVEWERGETGWVMGKKSWSFSKVSKLPPYHRNARISSQISCHLQHCKVYNKDKSDYKNLPKKVELPILSS